MLNENEKKIIYLVYVKGYTPAEIARVCHKSRQTVNQLKHRALKKLKRTMQVENSRKTVERKKEKVFTNQVRFSL